jgi:PAS domain S-box-containing protein
MRNASELIATTSAESNISLMTSEAEDPSRKLQFSYQLLFEKNPLAMWVYDCEILQLLAINEAASKQYGYSQREFVGLTLLDIHHAQDDVQPWRDYLCSPVNDKLVARFWRHQRSNGDTLEVETVVQEIEHEGKQANLMLIRDMTEQRQMEQQQREQAQRLTTTLESIADAFFTLDRDWCFTYVNAHAEELLHCTREELLGRNVWDKFPEAVGSIFQIEYMRAVAQNSTARFEAFYSPFGVWLAVDAYPSSQGLAVYFRDVSARRLAEKSLEEERQTLSAVLHSATDAILSIDEEEHIIMFNPGAERIFGRSRADMLGQSIDVLLPKRYRKVHIGHIRRFSGSGEANRPMGSGLVKGLRADGEEIDLEGAISHVQVNQQRVMIASLRDVTGRVRAERDSRQSRKQLSELTQKLMTQEKTLVRRLAQALHDQLGQTVAAIRVVHETLMAMKANNNAPGRERFEQQMSELIHQANRQIRQVLMELRPPLLEEQGLAAALDNELRHRALIHPQVGLSVEMKSEMSLMRWPADLEYAAFMVMREAVENALRHSGASAVTVKLSGSALALKLDVSDDGVGFKPDKKSRGTHLGILGMNERAQAVGASVMIGAGRAAGTRVSFNWRSPA